MSRRLPLIGPLLITVVAVFFTACGGSMQSSPASSNSTAAASPSLLSISVSPQNRSIPIDGSTQFSASGSYSDGSSKDLTQAANWNSSAPNVATVLQGNVSAVATGSANITASLGGKSGSSLLTVTSAIAVVALQITPANSVVPLNWTGHLSATALYNDGTTADVTSHVTWGAINGAIAIEHGILVNWFVANAGSTVVTAWYVGPDGRSAANASTTLTAGSRSPLFAFVADAGDNTLAELSLDESSGQMKQLTKVPVGENPSAITTEVLNDTVQRGFVYVANHDSNTVSAFSFDPSGHLTPVPGSPFAVSPHPNSVAMGYYDLHLFVAADDGLSEYLVDGATGALRAAPGSPYATGGQPTSVTASNFGWEAYATNANGGIAGYYFQADTTEALAPIPGSPFPSAAEPLALVFSPSGQLAFAAGLGSNSLSAYATALDFNQSSPAFEALLPLSETSPITSPSALATVQTPGTFNQFLYVTGVSTNTVSAGLIGKDGSVRPVSGSPYSTGVSPQAVEGEPTGQYLYVVNSGSGTISAFKIDPATGVLSPLPAATGFAKPVALAFSRYAP